MADEREQVADAREVRFRETLHRGGQDRYGLGWEAVARSAARLEESRARLERTKAMLRRKKAEEEREQADVAREVASSERHRETDVEAEASEEPPGPG